MPCSDTPHSAADLQRELQQAQARVRELEQALEARDEPRSLDDATCLRMLLTHLPDYMYWKDRERRFVRISDAFEGLLQLPADQILGRRDEDLFPAEIAHETAEDDRRVIEQGIALVNKLEGGEVSPGVTRWVLTTKLPWRNARGEVVGLFGVSRDITAQKRLEDSVHESERRLRVISDTVPFPVAATRVSDGEILYANRAFSEFIDVPIENLLGAKTPDLYVDTEQRDRILAAVQEHGRADGMELRLRRHDGTIVTAASSIIPIEIDGEDALMGAAADITQLKRREQELRDLSELKDVLLREVNHRVRNNLSTLAALIRQQTLLADGPEQTVLRRLQGQVEGLAAVHAMLSDTGFLPIELTTLCREVIGAALRTWPGAPTLRVSNSPCRAASQPAHQLALVLAELAANSVKHGAKDVPLLVDVSIEARGAGVRICVRDNGPGFPQAIVEGRERGLGLRLIDALVSYGLSGRLTLRNDHGASATLDLPDLLEGERGED